jgi:hypothetical protein
MGVYSNKSCLMFLSLSFWDSERAEQSCFLYNKNEQNQKKPKTPTIWDASPFWSPFWFVQRGVEYFLINI